MAVGLWHITMLTAVSAAAPEHAKEVDVAIVGAGYSGLAAARRLDQLARLGGRWNLSFHILEARDRPGGRTLNLDLAAGGVAGDDVLELGGEWLAPEHSEAISIFRDELGFRLFHRLFNSNLPRHPYRRPRRRLAAQLGDEPLAPQCPGECPIVVHTSVGTFNATTQLDAVTVLSKAAQKQIQRAEIELQRLVRTTPCSDPLSSLEAEDMDATTYAAWLRKHAPSKDARRYMATYADDAEAVDQISTLDVAWVMNCTSTVGSEGEDYYRIRGGSQGPALRLAEAVGADRLTFSSPVTAVRRSGDRWEVRSARRTLLAKFVIFAGLPPALLLGIAFEPALPGITSQMLQRTPMGDCMKYSVVYRTPWWRARGYLGNILSFSTDPNSSRISPYQCIDNSPYSWNRGVITCFMVGDQNRAFLRDLTKEQQLAQMTNYFAASFGEPPTDGSADVLNVSAVNWADEAYSRGAFGTFHPPGVLTSMWKTLAPILQESRLGPEGLWIAGADWSLDSFGYMEGALRTGRLAAERIAASVTRDISQYGIQDTMVV